jgi:hypothetical protein
MGPSAFPEICADADVPSDAQLAHAVGPRNGGGGTIPYAAALGSSCGKALSNSTSSPTAVTFTVTAPPASTWTAGQSGAITGNLQAVPSGQYSSSACT